MWCQRILRTTKRHSKRGEKNLKGADGDVRAVQRDKAKSAEPPRLRVGQKNGFVKFERLGWGAASTGDSAGRHTCRVGGLHMADKRDLRSRRKYTNAGGGPHDGRRVEREEDQACEVVMQRMMAGAEIRPSL